MSTARSRQTRTVTLTSPNGAVSLEYATLGEAKRQADAWVAEAIQFTRRDGADFRVVALGTTAAWHVVSYASSASVDVIEKRDGESRMWGRGEVIACHDRRFRHAA